MNDAKEQNAATKTMVIKRLPLWIRNQMDILILPHKSELAASRR
jgi:hypothetical protein